MAEIRGTPVPRPVFVPSGFTPIPNGSANTLNVCQLRDWAERVVLGDRLEDKLSHPGPNWIDDAPGPPRRHLGPGRPAELRISDRRLPYPKLTQLRDPSLRARCLHSFANHELMAIELMAFALCAFPDAPPAFRGGVVRTISDEQRHLRAYMARMVELGTSFGELPVNGYFWKQAADLTTPLRYLCALSLTFEAGNLDHAPLHADAFAAAGDDATAKLMTTVQEDEIAHVRFGVAWLRQFKDPGRGDAAAYVDNLVHPLTARRAKGPRFDREARLRAGMDAELIALVDRA